MPINLAQLPLVTFKSMDEPHPAEVFKLLLLKLCDLTWEQVISQSRKPAIVEARFLYGTFMSRHFEVTLQVIGEHLNRHHSTVINGRRQIDKHLRSRDPAYDQLRTKYATLDTFLTSQSKRNDRNNHRASVVRHHQAAL